MTEILVKHISSTLSISKTQVTNTCAHPNNIIISESKASSFIEDIVDNVLLLFI